MKDEMLSAQAQSYAAQQAKDFGVSNAPVMRPAPVRATPARPAAAHKQAAYVPPPASWREGGTSAMRPMPVAVLYLLNFLFGFSALLGLGLAYVWLTDDRLEEWEKSHMAYLIRTFWVGFASIAAMVVLFVLTVGTAFTAMEDGAGRRPVGELYAALVASSGVFMLAMLWSLIRILRSMLRAGAGKAMPRTWLI